MNLRKQRYNKTEEPSLHTYTITALTPLNTSVTSSYTLSGVISTVGSLFIAD